MNLEEGVVYYSLPRKYNETDSIINIIPSHKTMSIIRAVISTAQMLTAPGIVLNVLVHHTKGNP